VACWTRVVITRPYFKREQARIAAERALTAPIPEPTLEVPVKVGDRLSFPHTHLLFSWASPSFRESK
jgi:hypothetical protein